MRPHAGLPSQEDHIESDQPTPHQMPHRHIRFRPAVVCSSVIEIVLPSGITIRTSGHVDAAVLRSVLAELGGR
jgi:hypothetical protein